MAVLCLVPVLSRFKLGVYWRPAVAIVPISKADRVKSPTGSTTSENIKLVPCLVALYYVLIGHGILLSLRQSMLYSPFRLLGLRCTASSLIV
jgi:hypothetical protein